MKNFILGIVAGLLAVLLGWQIYDFFRPAESPAAEWTDADDTDYAEDRDPAKAAENAASVDMRPFALSRFGRAPLTLGDLDSSAVGNTLFVRYAATACPPCVAHVRAAVNDFAEASPDARIVMLISGESLRGLHVREKEDRGRYSYFAVDSLPLDCYAGAQPVIFYLSPSGRASRFFVQEYGDSVGARAFLGLNES